MLSSKIGKYSPSSNNTKYSCTNKPSGVSNVTYTSDGNGSNSCHGTYIVNTLTQSGFSYFNRDWSIRMKSKDRTGNYPTCGTIPKYALVIYSPWGSKLYRYSSYNAAASVTSKVIGGHTIYKGSWVGYGGACGGTSRKHWKIKYYTNQTKTF